MANEAGSTYSKRRAQLRRLLGDADGMLVTNETNVRYLTGFTGDSTYLMVTKGSDGALLISDPRYEEQIEHQCPDVQAAIRKPSELLVPFACKQLKKLKLGKVLFEQASVSVATHEQLSEHTSVQWHGAEPLVEQLRSIKDAGEVATIRRAVEIAERAMVSMQAQLQSGQTELQFAHELEHTMRRLGAEGCSFDPIVAVGPQSALPHAQPGGRRMDADSFVLFDWGATVDGYRSDLTRVVATSRIPAKISRAFAAVLAAQQAAIDALKPGILGSEVDAIVRDVLSEHGVEKRFNHGLGHGIGLDIHESPRMGKNFAQPLQAGMVVTVEPGVYFPGIGGIRIEDDVLITQDGAEVLSSLPRSLEENHVSLLG